MKSNLHSFVLILGCAFSPSLRAQQPPATSPGQSTSQAPAGKHSKYAGHIILSGTVFTEKGFTLPGAQVQARRVGEKKVRAEDVSNRAGEFWMHVPGGVEYEMTAKVHGFEPQTIKIEASAESLQNLVFRLKPLGGGKK